MSFKKGDKIKCTLGIQGVLTEGKVYTAETDQSDETGVQVVDDKGRADSFYSERFEPVPPPKVGDLVEVTEGHLSMAKGSRFRLVFVGESNARGILVHDAGNGVARRPMFRWNMRLDLIRVIEKETLDSFKAKVWEKAQKAKREHGWCSEVDAILAELGVSDPNPRPEEPKGLGAVVEDGEGRFWVRDEYQQNEPWSGAHGGGRYPWDELPESLVVRSEGYVRGMS